MERVAADRIGAILYDFGNFMDGLVVFSCGSCEQQKRH